MDTTQGKDLTAHLAVREALPGQLSLAGMVRCPHCGGSDLQVSKFGPAYFCFGCELYNGQVEAAYCVPRPKRTSPPKARRCAICLHLQKRHDRSGGGCSALRSTGGGQVHPCRCTGFAEGGS
jgi:hypothetical protein